MAAEEKGIKPNFVSKRPRFEDIRFEVVYRNMMEKMRYITLDDHELAPMLNTFVELSTHPYTAWSLVNCPMWLPNRGGGHDDDGDVRGRDLEHYTVLGSFLRVNVTPEWFLSSLKELVDITDLYAIMNNLSMLQTRLATVFASFLHHTNTRDNILVYLAQVINKNSMRDRIHVDQEDYCASSGMFVNLSGVMLLLAEVHLDKYLMMSGDEIDIRYVSEGRRVDFSGLTTLHQVSAGNRRRLDCAGEKSAYSFRCELFFMTARILHLGLVKVVSDSKLLDKNITLCRQELTILQQSYPEEKEKLTNLEEKLHMYLAEQKCIEIQILKNKTLVERAVSFYRLMVVRLISLVGGPRLPLPITCPEEFASIPEHFVDDIMILLDTASALQIKLDEGMMKDFIIFIVMFMPSPEYIRNPHLRVKMVEFLDPWMLNKDVLRSDEAFLLVKPTSVSKFLVRSLLKTLIDMEVLPNISHFKKYQRKIITLLIYLWKVDSHHDEWTQIANNEEKGLYLKFLKFLIEDSISLLDYSFGICFEIEQAPKKMAYISYCVHMAVALDNVYLLAETSQHITSPFLLPDIVEEVVNMLNYILSQLRKLFRSQGTSVCGPNPIKLLERTVEIYVNLDRADNNNVFPAIIIKTDSTYDEHLFIESVRNIVVKNERQKKLVEDFIELGYKVKVAAVEEAALGEIPEEFLDPIQCTLMKDPVVLPSSKVNIDRPVISRHLLRSQNDPFTRSYLNVDMLTPNMMLKGKIEEFIRNKLLKQNYMERQNQKDTT